MYDPRPEPDQRSGSTSPSQRVKTKIKRFVAYSLTVFSPQRTEMLLYTPFQSGKYLRKLQSQVNMPVPLAILAFSPSSATLDLIISAFQGSSVTSVKTVDDLVEQMKLSTEFNLFIIDCQTSRALEAVKQHANPLSPPNILRLLAPSIEALRSRSEVLEGVSILYHPIRRRKLLDMSRQLSTRLKRRVSAEERLPAVPMSPAPLKTIEHFTDDERETLATCHVLIAEDNPVASKLLVKTLVKGAGVKVTATDNGSAAVNEWASHPEGHFALALFDQCVPSRSSPFLRRWTSFF